MMVLSLLVGFFIVYGIFAYFMNQVVKKEDAADRLKWTTL